MSPSPYQRIKLDELAMIRNPVLRIQKIMEDNAVAEAIFKMGVIEGYSPKKGIDYFTPQEVEDIVKYIQSVVVKDGKDGINGTNGKDGEKGPKGDSIPGKSGLTPIRGVDYWTPDDRKTIIKELKTSIPKNESIKVPTIEEIISEFKRNPIHYKDIKGTPDLKDLPALIEFLKMGGFRGGAGTATPTTAITETPTGVIDGVNKVFTITKTPISGSFLLFLNGQYQAGSGIDFTLTGKTITYVTAPDIGFAGLPFFAQYLY